MDAITLTPAPTPAAPPRSGPMLQLVRAVGWVVACAVAGAALGAVARGWMRLLSDDPEFSWSGTIAIVVVFTVAGAGHGLAARARRARRRRWSTLGRVVGGVLTLGLFVAAGGVMLPTVAGGSLAVWRRDWPRWTRALPAAVALPVPVSIAWQAADGGLSGRRLLGLVLFAATYTVIIRALEPVVAPVGSGWRLARWARVAAVVAGLAAAAAATLLAVGFAFNPDAS